MFGKKSITIPLIELFLSALLLLLSIFDFGGLIKGIFIFIGVLMIIANLIPLVAISHSNDKTPSLYADMVMSIIGIVLGALFIFEHGLVLKVIVIVYMVIMPIIRICSASDKMLELKKSIILFVVAALLLLNIFDFILQIVLIVVFSILTLLSFISLIKALVAKKNDDDNDFNGFGFDDYDNNENQEIDVNKNEDAIDAEFKEL